MNQSTRIFGLIAAVISAIAFYYGTGLHPHWWLTWVAAAPVLAYGYGASRRAAAAIAFATFLLGELNLWAYFRVLEIPVLVRCLALVGMALAFTAGVVLSRSLFRRGRFALSLIALPVVWETFEFASSWGRNGTALNLSYSQMDCLPLLQLASITGIWGIGFFVFLISSVLAQLLYSGNLSKIAAASSAIVFLVVFAYGAFRLSIAPTGREVHIGLAASDSRPLLGDEAKATALTDFYESAIDRLAKGGAEIIVLPEKIMTTSDYQAGDFHRRLSEAAGRNSVTVIAGVDQKGAPLKHNLALALSPSHETVYEKHHMVVGWEDEYEVGTTSMMLPPPNENIGVQICKDMDFPRLSRAYGNSGAQLMLVPAWDFEIDDWLHGRMAIMRGVESGFAIARSAKQGFMTLSDNRGRILSEKRSDATGNAMLIGTIRLSADRTIYSRLGDWFAWLNLVALAALIWSLSRRAPVKDKVA